MSEAGKDPGIKLFGRTIPPPEGQDAAGDEPGEGPDLDPMIVDSVSVTASEPCEDGVEKDVSREVTNGELKDQTPNCSKEIHWNEADATSSLNDNQQTHSSNDKATPSPKPELGQANGGFSGQEKVLKKPDKILPCPRCNSMDTKFCYYNNYNVNQPRHFCKNCQRYWTAGGTMRNVPVGAGRRKNKHSASHYRHLIMSSDGITSPRVDASDSTHVKVLPCRVLTPMTPLKENGAVPKFSQEAPLCQSVLNNLNISEQKGRDDSRDTDGRENGEEQSSTSFKGSNGVVNDPSRKSAHVEKNGAMPSCNGLAPMQPMQCFPGPPWPCPWPPGWNNVAPLAAGQCTSELAGGQENCNPHPIPWNPTPVIAAPAFCAPTIPFPFVPASFWGCMSGWPNGTWSMPWIGTHGGLSPSSLASNSGGSGNKSATLGKHSRDLSKQGDEKGEKSLWIPKTLRIDDPDEAAKSSIWATLGIKLNQNEPSRKGGIFKAFQSKTEGSSHHQSEATHVLHANPAALSRSQTFQEST